MRALFRGTITVTAALVAAVFLYLSFTLPRRPIALDAGRSDRVLYGAFHVHSTRSDGTGSVDDIARAAERAGLDWVVITDHGDGTRQPDAPAYLHGVLILDAVEVSTSSGHVVAMGVTEASPFPLAGRADDVIADIHRMGGWAVAAHPDSPNSDLRWRRRGLDYDGIEWLNADSEWRDESWPALAGTSVRGLFRPAEAVTSLFRRPDRTLQRWDDAARRRPVVGLAAVDAHGGLSDDDGRSGGLITLVPAPGFAAMFGTVVQAVPLDAPPTGDAAVDGRHLLDALAAGRTYSVVRALAWPATLEFKAISADGGLFHSGQQVPTGVSVESISARVPEAPGGTLELLRNGERVVASRGELRHAGLVAPGAYRVEVRIPEADVPWIVSNPIYVGEFDPPASDVQAETPAPPADASRVELPADERWVIEHAPGSSGTVMSEAGALRFSYELGPGEPAGQYAALVSPVQAESGFDRIQFVAWAEHPMRLSVQLRLPGGRDGLRWRRSVYVGLEPTLIEVLLADLEPVGGSTTQQPLVARVESVLFVVDTVNARPGDRGVVTISDVGLRVGDVTSVR